MHDVLAVKEPESGERLVRDLERERDRGGPDVASKLRKVDPVDELHDDVSHPVGVEREVEDRADVRVLQPGRGLRLLREAAAQLLVRADVRAHDLDDANLVEEAVADLVDGPHSAFPDLREDLVLAFDQGTGDRHGDPTSRRTAAIVTAARGESRNREHVRCPLQWSEWP